MWGGPLVIHDFATDPCRISLYMRKIVFFFFISADRTYRYDAFSESGLSRQNQWTLIHIQPWRCFKNVKNFNKTSSEKLQLQCAFLAGLSHIPGGWKVQPPGGGGGGKDTVPRPRISAWGQERISWAWRGGGRPILNRESWAVPVTGSQEQELGSIPGTGSQEQELGSASYRLTGAGVG